MSKLLSSVLDKVSENNNEYRRELRTLNAAIDEKTTALVGDIVTISSYTADFSNTITSAKEKLVNPVSRIIESYVIRDLRSVETVNEQFVEKINDKLDNANITTPEEKESFTQNLHSLLNDKYLEIVKIKRVSFTDENEVNADVENAVSSFVNYLKTIANFDEEKLLSLFIDYKNEIYKLISNTLSKISDLYLNNFVSEVSNALNGAIDYDVPLNNVSDETEFKPFIPEIPVVPEVPEIPAVPEIPIVPEIPVVPETPTTSSSVEEVVEPMDVTPIKPIEIKEEQVIDETPKRSYDVEEILKIAKSPIVVMPEEKLSNDDSYVNVEPIVSEKEQDTMDTEFNEREIVEEMIRRLQKRLEEIDTRRAEYEEEQRKLEEDEEFVNDLIESSSVKKQELDKFEQELDDKEKELEEKQKELDKKINDVMPFANAVLNSEKES